MRILLLVFQATPKSHQDDTVFRSAAPGGYSASGPVDQARQAEARRDLNGTFHRPNAPNLLQASAQILAPVLPGELQQTP
jgi:hypothetical protein